MTRATEQEFTAQIEAPVTACFETITDFDAYPKWSSPVERTVVVERYPDGLARLVEFLLDMKLRTVRYVLEYCYEPPRRLEWRSVDGDIEAISGSYVFEPVGRAGTRATCRQAVSLGFWIPGPIRSALEKQALRTSVLEFKTEVERRQAAARGRRRKKS